MHQTTYKTDLTEAEFTQIKPCLQVHRKSKWPLLALLNAIFYVDGEGVKWRGLPGDFGIPWQTVYFYFAKWSKDKTFKCINEQLVLLRRQSGVLKGGLPPKSVLPTTLIIDSQSVKNTATSGQKVGVDGGKKIKGRKRMILTDSQGNLLAVRVYPANKHDGPAAWHWWQTELCHSEFFSEVALIKGDQHFGGVFKNGVEGSTSIKVEVRHGQVEKATQQKMKVHKGRWVVERTFAGSDNDRRLSKDYERRPENTEAFVLISSIKRILKNPMNTG